MSKYDELPVYKASYELMTCIYSFASDFSREHKHTIGEKMKDEMFELFLILYRTNRAEKKYDELERGREKVERIKLLVRLSKDLKLLNIKRFAHLNSKIQEVSKQICGWQKSLEI